MIIIGRSKIIRTDATTYSRAQAECNLYYRTATGTKGFFHIIFNDLLGDPLHWSLVPEITHDEYNDMPLVEVQQEGTITVSNDPVTEDAIAATSTEHLFHRLWTKAVGTKSYVKKQWLALDARIKYNRP